MNLPRTSSKIRPKRKTARQPSADRYTAILESASELFARKGIRATTVREIAEQVGLLSGSLYHHFPSKEAIVDEIITRYLDALLGSYREVLAADLDPRSRLHGLVTASLETAKAAPDATVIYQNELDQLRQRPGYGHIQAAVHEVQQSWLDVIEDGRARGAFRSDIAPPVFYRLIRDAVWLSVKWFRPDGSKTLAQFANDCTSVFLDGLGAREPATG